jgi:type IV secretion system protein VirD4
MIKLIDLLFELVGELFKLLWETCKLLWSLFDTGFTPSKKYEASLTRPGQILKKNGIGWSMGGVYSVVGDDVYRSSTIIGSTGSNKTTSVAVVSLLNLCGHASVIALDPSRELEKIVRSKYEEAGYEIVRLDFSDRTGDISDGYNLFPEDPDDLPSFIDAMIQIQLGSETKDPFWNLSASLLLQCIASTLYSIPKEYRTMTTLYDLLTYLSGAKQEVVEQFICKHATEKAYSEYTSFANNSDNLKASVFSTAKSVIQLFSQDGVRRITSTSTFDLTEIRDKKMLILLQTNPAEIERYKLLISIFFEQLISSILRQGVRQNILPVNIILDEAGIIKVPILPSSLVVMRKYKLGVQILCQSEEQLIKNYGTENASTILNNTMTTLYMSGQSLKVAQRLQELSGKVTYEEEENGFKTKNTRYLLLADEIRSLPNDKAILLYGNHRICVVPVLPYFKNPRYRKITNLPYTEPERKLPVETVPMFPIEQFINEQGEPTYEN